MNEIAILWYTIEKMECAIMESKETILKGLKWWIDHQNGEVLPLAYSSVVDTYELLLDYDKEIKALRLLVEWAEECDFGFDQFPDEYERYKNEITDMKYIDAMIHVAKRTLEDHGAFEER